MISCAFLVGGSVCAQIIGFKPDSEPDGFRGIKWGQDISTVNGLVYVATDPSHGGEDYYIREGDELKMGAALSLKGPLKINTQCTETERNEQEGIMHLCIGLMRAIRNPEAHEPELNWSITQEDDLNILSLISFLWRKIDGAVIWRGVL